MALVTKNWDGYDIDIDSDGVLVLGENDLGTAVLDVNVDEFGEDYPKLRLIVFGGGDFDNGCMMTVKSDVRKLLGTFTLGMFSHIGLVSVNNPGSLKLAVTTAVTDGNINVHLCTSEINAKKPDLPLLNEVKQFNVSVEHTEDHKMSWSTIINNGLVGGVADLNILDDSKPWYFQFILSAYVGEDTAHAAVLEVSFSGIFPKIELGGGGVAAGGFPWLILLAAGAALFLLTRKKKKERGGE